MQDLTYLSKLTPEEFEAERARLISEFIQDAPKEQQAALINTQARLDVLRETVPSEQFLRSVFSEMGDNMQKLNEHFTELNEKIKIEFNTSGVLH
jgi:predicted hydrolase (HD superfamily)